MHKHAFQLYVVLHTCHAVLVFEAIDLALGAGDLSSLGIGVHRDVGQAVELVDQHSVGLELVGKFHHRHVGHDAGQVNGGFNARVTTTNHRRLLTLEQRAIAMRAIGYTLVFVLGFAGHIYIAPARAGGQDHGFGFERAAICQLHFHQATRLGGGDELTGLLQVHDIYAVLAHLGFQGSSKLGAVGFHHRDVVLNRHGVIGLATKAFGRHTSANALASSVHRSRCAGRAATDDEHVIRVFGRQLSGVLGSGAGVELGHNFFDQHATVTEQRAIQVDARHRHNFALGHLSLESTAFDNRGFDLGVEDGHQTQGLHHVWAVVARQAHVDFEIEVAAFCRAQTADLFDNVRLDLWGVATAPQQGQHQRGEFMAQRQACKS